MSTKRYPQEFKFQVETVEQAGSIIVGMWAARCILSYACRKPIWLAR